MKNSKAAVISCLGLGDGLLALVLSNNLAKNGCSVTTFHPFLSQLQPWFPHLPIASFPYEKIDDFVADHEIFFFIYDKKMDPVIDLCQKIKPRSTYVLNPVATPNCDYPYWEHGRFNGRIPFSDNLMRFCQDVLRLEHVTKENGIKIPESFSRVANRVIIHPTSSRPSKNWPKVKFLQLAEKLENDGFETAWILTKEERAEWSAVNAPEFSNLSDMVDLVSKSGFMIGNDSGIGHLASALGLPTLTICRHSMVANFWRPSWARNEVVLPPKWIPNLKGIRLRDKHWQKFISADKVYQSFLKLNYLS